MTRSWGGFDPSDPQFQQALEQAQRNARDAQRRADKPPKKPTPMQRWLDPEGAKKIDQMRSSWGKKGNAPKEKRGFLGRKKKNK